MIGDEQVDAAIRVGFDAAVSRGGGQELDEVIAVQPLMVPVVQDALPADARPTKDSGEGYLLR